MNPLATSSSVSVTPDGHQLGHLVVDDRQQLGHPRRAGAGVDPGRAGVAVRRRPRVDRVAEAPLLADLLEQAAGHAAAQDLVGDRRGRSGRRRSGRRPASPWRRAPARCRRRARRRARPRPSGRVRSGMLAALEPTERAGEGVDEPVVLEVAGRDDDQVARAGTSDRRTRRSGRGWRPRRSRGCRAPRGRAGARGTAPRPAACGRGPRARRGSSGSPRRSPGARRRPRGAGTPAR